MVRPQKTALANLLCAAGSQQRDSHRQGVQGDRRPPGGPSEDRRVCFIRGPVDVAQGTQVASRCSRVFQQSDSVCKQAEPMTLKDLEVDKRIYVLIRRV